MLKCVNYSRMRHKEYFRCRRGNNICRKGKCRTCPYFKTTSAMRQEFFKKLFRRK